MIELMSIAEMDDQCYLVMTPDTTEEQAIQAFIRRYGMQPKHTPFIMFPNREVWIGPVPETNDQVKFNS